MRRRSKTIFGQELRLAVCLFVGRHPTGTFSLTEAAAAIGVASSAIQAPLNSLVQAEVVERLELKIGNERIRPLQRRESRLWLYAEEVLGFGPADQLQLPL